VRSAHQPRSARKTALPSNRSQSSGPPLRITAVARTPKPEPAESFGLTTPSEALSAVIRELIHPLKLHPSVARP
jgi:hypothetical protein